MPLTTLNKFIFSLLLFLTLSPWIMGETLQFHPAFSDNMVLQREAPVSIFGKGKPGSKVTVTWKDQNPSTEVTKEGKWKIILSALQASSEPGVLTAASENEKVSCNNVLVGDLWFCSGQSNMERPFSTYSVLKETLPSLENPLIRLYHTARVISTKPLSEPLAPTNKNDADSNQWHECKTEFLENFSPLAYFFAAKVSRELKIPIGILVSAWGGTQAECWTPQETLEALNLKIEFQVNPNNPSQPHETAILYNSMIHPFLDLTFKGFLWYQGESNSKWPENYKIIFPAMIQSWRDRFQGAERPFYFVQIAPYTPLPWDLTGGEAWAWIREAQMSALSLPKTGMVVTTDRGEYVDIHPQDKKPVAERLALFALRDAGHAVQPESPRFDSLSVKGNRCLIRFKNALSGLETRQVIMNNKKNLPIQKDPEAFVVEADSVKGFTICGEDQKFIEAQAKIVEGEVEVWSEMIPRPVAVRYAWKSFPLCNLFSKEGLPVAPFRSDSFPMPVLFQVKGEQK